MVAKKGDGYKTKTIFAGKYRRYSGEAWYRGFLDPKRTFFNLRDIFLLAIGFLQSLIILIFMRPKAVFIKGGFVGVPIGVASWLLKIPYITHDSDAVPGLTNRLISKHAKFNAVGMPPENYRYPKHKIKFVGVPVDDEFLKLASEGRARSRTSIGLPVSGLTLLEIGGSLGAQRVDRVLVEVNQRLLDEFPDLNIIHQLGRGNDNIYQDYPKELQKRLILGRFIKPISKYMKSADVVVTRAGATTLAELSVLSTSAVVIPNPYLTSSHQVINAKILAKDNAIVMVDESVALQKQEELFTQISILLRNRAKRQELGRKLHEIIPANATNNLAKLILGIIEK